MNKQTIRDADVAGKRVFVRVDFNVPLADGKVTDDSRIRAAIPTIKSLVDQGARVILASHLGRPKGKVQDGLRLRPVGQRLTELIRRNVPVTGDALGLGTEDALKRMRPGEVLLLENLRFHAEEEANDPEFAKTLASYADIYVNDAFGTAHRAHASTVGIAELLPAYAGLLMERELEMLSKLLEAPERPFAAILGGAKVSDKIAVIDNLLTKVDLLVLGGGMANTFLLAQGKSVGKSLAEHDRVDDAKRILSAAGKRGVRIVLPVDVIVAKEVTRGTEYKTLLAEKIPASWHIVDMGAKSLELMQEALSDARTIFWNGPLGVFEIPSFAHGTNAIARTVADRAEHGATVVVGGGDSVAAITQQGLADRMTHISTGGGASLEFLEGRELPGVTVLLDKVEEPPKRRRRQTKAKQQRRRRRRHDHLHRVHRRAGDPRLAWQSDGRGRRSPRRRIGRPRRGSVRSVDRCPRGGRAARRRQEPVRWQGRAAGRDQRHRDHRAGAVRAGRIRPGRDRRRPDRPRRDAEQGRARGERDPRRVAGCRPRLGGLLRSAAVPLSRRGRRADAAGPDVQHPQRREARPGLHGLPGVHGHARRHGDVLRRAARRGRDLRGAALDPARRGARHRTGRRGRVRAVTAVERGRDRGDPARGRPRGVPAGRADRDRPRSRHLRARGGG